MAEFLDSLDIAKRTCQHVGCTQIQTIDEDSRQQNEISTAYGKRRLWELRRNVWTFACKKVILRALTDTTMLLAPKVWDAAVTYLPGSIVSDTNGELWVSYQPGNIDNEPGKNYIWDKYFGPMTADLWDSEESYSAGELVYKLVGDPGGYVVFVSLRNANEDNPSTATAYDAAVTYNKDDTVTSGGFQYRSLIELNVGTTPAEAPTAWDIGASYISPQAVTASDGYIYICADGQLTAGYDPVTNPSRWTNTHVPAAWTKIPTLYPSSIKWLPIFAALSSMEIIYPLGCGPSSQSSTHNVFRLPAGYLREAPQNPKAGIASYLGAARGNAPLDWEHNGKYIISDDFGPIPYRFVADVTYVPDFDAMFCETLAASIALVVAEPITQSNAKLSTIAKIYSQFESDAIAVNAIEQGAEEPPEDDFITARL